MTRTRRLAPLAVLLAAAVPSALWGGAVTTRDGKTIEGRVGWGDGGAVLVRPAGGEAHSFPLAEVAAARFDREPAAGGTVPATGPMSGPNTGPTTGPAAGPGGWVDGEVGAADGDATIEADAARVVAHDHGKPLYTGRRSEKKGQGDSLHFVYRQAGGDFDLKARVYADDEHGGPAGLMARESLDPDAPYVLVARGAAASDGPWKTRLQGRPDRGAAAERIAVSETGILGATWLRLKRTGARFEAFESPNGKTWTPVGQVDVPFTARSPAYVGLASACGEGRESVFYHPRLAEAEAGPARAGPLQAVVFRDGTVLAAEVSRADEGQITWRRGGREQTTPVRDLARVLLRPVTAELAARLDAAPGPGLLLTGGDFVEGEFKGIADGRAGVSSLLFGLRTFDVDRQVAAVVWARPGPAAAGWRVMLADGSRLAADAVAAAGSGVLKIRCPVAGEMDVRSEDVTELSEAGGAGGHRP